MIITNRTIHSVGSYRVSFGTGDSGLEFKIMDQGGGYVTGLVESASFVDRNYGTSGPNSEPVFTQKWRDALLRALEERNGGDGAKLQDREVL